MTPLNATEWLEALRIGTDLRAADYAGEARRRYQRKLELIEQMERAK